MEEKAQEIVEESDSKEVEEPVKKKEQSNNDQFDMGLELPEIDLGIDF